MEEQRCKLQTEVKEKCLPDKNMPTSPVVALHTPRLLKLQHTAAVTPRLFLNFASTETCV